MSCSATAQTAGFRPGMAPADLGPRTDSRLDRTMTAVDDRLGGLLERALGTSTDEWVDDLRWRAQGATAGAEAWQAEKVDAVDATVEDYTGHRLNQGARGIVGVAVGVMATLMIAVVVLGQIDQFTPGLSNTWSNTADNVSDQSQDTFDFLNLVPFLIVALFILGLMMSRM